MNDIPDMDLNLRRKMRIIAAASGREKSDLVLKNAAYLNVFTDELCHGDIAITEGIIVGIGEYEGMCEENLCDKIVIPGFIDAHIHLESSLVSPAEFARAVLPHGTTTVVTDPHEIANVMGLNGIRYMLAATVGLPIDILFMLPSCVPATPLDEAGAQLLYREINPFYENRRVLGLAEMMNYIGVVRGDPEPIEKIVAAQSHHKKIDGHAPGLSGKELCAYISAGVYSDHECANLDEALEKLRMGQFVMIREGTAAQNLAALSTLLGEKTNSRCMFASDDKHPSDLLRKGHIDYCVKKAVSLGANPILALKAATHNAARYYLMNNKGAVAPGYAADLAIITDLNSINVERVYKDGILRYNGQLLPFDSPKLDAELTGRAHSTFRLEKLKPEDFCETRPRGVIGVVPGEIITRDLGTATAVDVERDILKIVVIERHRHTGHMGIGYIGGYGLRHGAVASSISHDSHNIIAVGTNDSDLALAANRIRDMSGGIAVVLEGKVLAELALPIAGLMSEDSLTNVNEKLEAAKDAAFSLGVSRGIDPFMTLSFMSLPVIPKLRLTTRGVVDVLSQRYV